MLAPIYSFIIRKCGWRRQPLHSRIHSFLSLSRRRSNLALVTTEARSSDHNYPTTIQREQNGNDIHFLFPFSYFDIYNFLRGPKTQQVVLTRCLVNQDRSRDKTIRQPVTQLVCVDACAVASSWPFLFWYAEYKKERDRVLEIKKKNIRTTSAHAILSVYDTDNDSHH